MPSPLRWFLTALATFFWGTLSLVGSLIDRSGNFSHSCMRQWSRWCLAFGQVRLEISGLENIKGPGPWVVTANHQGQIDILILAAVLPFRFLWVAKKELFRIPFMGWHMKRCGYIPIDRSSRERSLESMKLASEKIRYGHSIMFFPEGTRSKDGTLQRFKSGAFFLALDTKAPVLPVVIDGSHRVLPKGSFHVSPSTIRFTILPPIPTEGREVGERDALKDEVRRSIFTQLGQGFDGRRLVG